ncbi:unnamed protein product, partial [marine sediment metagenome]
SDGKNYVLTISRDISERKEAAQKLIESEKKYKELANSLPEVIFEIDLKFKLVYTNAIASKIFGYSHEEFKKGLNVFDFILEEDRDEVIRNLSLIFRGKTVDPLIMQLKKKDGTIFYGSLNATPIYKGTTIIGMRSIIHDVTEMVKAEERIKESEEQLRTISDQSLMGISIIQEEIKRGKEFIKLVKEITPKKPIVAIYTGGTKAADRAIMSHTGSLGGNQKIYDAVFKDSGIISTNSITDFLYYLRTLSFAQKYNIFMKGNRVGIITDSGGSGSMMT